MIFLREKIKVLQKETEQNLDISGLPECKGCGKCCRNLKVRILDGTDDGKIDESMIEYYFGSRYMKRNENGACVALDQNTNLCTIYENRPKICKDFQRGNPQCRNLFDLK